MSDGRIRVAVVFGGANVEHEVSCRSAASVLEHLDRDRYEPLPVRIGTDGGWTVGEATGPVRVATPPAPATAAGDLSEALRVLSTVDVVFPVLHGMYGEDGRLQSLLDLIGLPYVGSGVLASAAGMDKDVTKRLLVAEGLTVARYLVVDGQDGCPPRSAVEHLGLPVFVKPARTGSSIGVHRVDRWDELAAAVHAASGHDRKVMIEEAVQGREIDIGVLEYPDGRVEAGAPLEIRVGGGHQFFDFAAKYEDPATAFDVPARLDAPTAHRLQQTAIQIFQTLGCSGLLRVDFFLRAQGEIVVNEVNTMPGLTAASQYPKMWQARGLPFAALIDVLISTALAPDVRRRPAIPVRPRREVGAVPTGPPQL